MLAALQLPAKGTVSLLGASIEKVDRSTWKHLRTKTGYVSGDTPLLSVQSGLINVMLPALYHQVAPAADVERKANELLERLGCHGDVTVLPSFMSLLDRCLVSLARALILEPVVLFLEHPFQNLGTDDRKALALVLENLKQHDHLCIIAAVNNLPFVREYSDQIIYASETKTKCYTDWQAFTESSDPEIHRYFEDEDLG